MSAGRRGRPPPQPPGDAERPFPKDILAGPTLEAARALLGARLVRDPLTPQAADPHEAGGAPAGRRVGRIVEVEAYIGLDDRASHARMGPTGRNQVMFGPPGIAYVYLVYGHVCINVVTEAAGFPAAVLLRSVVPTEGAEAMRAARVQRAVAYRREDPEAARARLARVPVARLAIGPGNLAAAFSVERTHNGLDLLDAASPIRLELPLEDDPMPAFVATPRVGVAHAGPMWAGKPWRFVVPGLVGSLAD